jgi:hypothetical protein
MAKRSKVRIDIDSDAVKELDVRNRMPMAAILSSAGEPSGRAGRSGRTTQTPTRSSRRSPRTLKAASVPMIHCSSAATKARTSSRRRFRSSMT